MMRIEPAGQRAERRQDQLASGQHETAPRDIAAAMVDPELRMEMARQFGPRLRRAPPRGEAPVRPPRPLSTISPPQWSTIAGIVIAGDPDEAVAPVRSVSISGLAQAAGRSLAVVKAVAQAPDLLRSGGAHERVSSVSVALRIDRAAASARPRANQLAFSRCRSATSKARRAGQNRAPCGSAISSWPAERKGNHGPRLAQGAMLSSQTLSVSPDSIRGPPFSSSVKGRWMPESSSA